MKKLSIFFLSGIIILFIFANFSLNRPQLIPDANTAKKEIPENVLKVIKKSCYGCHNSESGNEDAKAEISFDKWSGYSSFKKIGKLKEIHETVSKNEMPPKRFLKKYPERKLTELEAKALIEWTKKEQK
jgi:hypothetical protein